MSWKEVVCSISKKKKNGRFIIISIEDFRKEFNSVRWTMEHLLKLNWDSLNLANCDFHCNSF